MKDKSIIQFIIDRRKKVVKERKKMKLTLDEELKYNQLKTDNSFPFPLSIFLFPFYYGFWIGLFTIVFDYAYGIDLKVSALLITSLLFKYWGLIIVVYVALCVVMGLMNIRSNKRLIKQIILERKK